MDTTNENMLQVNTFSNGMDTDTSDMLISDKSYRLAKNLRYITDVDETTGELRLIEGATNINFDNTGIEGYKILAFNSIRNVGALVLETSDTAWSIYRVEHINGLLHVDPVFGPCNTPIGKDTKISTVLKWEADEKLLLYIADGEHPLMKINMYDDTHSSDIKYISSLIQHVNLNNIVVDSVLDGGSLQSGLVQYCYRLYNKNNVATQLAPLSEVKAIVNRSSSTRAGGLLNQEVSSMGLKVKVEISNDVSNLYPKMQLYRIQYLVNGQLPKVSLVFDDYYDKEDNKFYFSDLGYSSLQELTVEEFNSMLGIEIIPKVIESKNNILFAGNIQYSPDILDLEYLDMDFRAFSMGDKYEDNAIVYLYIDGLIEGSDQYKEFLQRNYVNENLDLSEQYDRSKWIDIHDVTRIGGTGKNIRWTLTVINDAYELNNFSDNRYAGIDELKINNKRTSDEKVVLNARVRSLAHDEIYRYGIILYSKSGTKYPVKWIADIRTPNIDYSRTNNNLRLDSTLSDVVNEKEYANVLGILFEINPGVLDQDKIAGYEIVRAYRTVNDRATISQGVVSSTIKVKDNEVCVSGMPFLDHVIFPYTAPSLATGEVVYLDQVGDNYTPVAETTLDVLQFYSPELLYLQDDVLSLLKNNKNFYLLAVCPLYSKLSESINNYDLFYLTANSDSTPTLNTYIKIYQGENETVLALGKRYLASNFYSDQKVQYKLFTALLSNNDNDIVIPGGSTPTKDCTATEKDLNFINQRKKWYTWNSSYTHFTNPEISITFSRQNLLDYLNGLNVYKLLPMLMPESFWSIQGIDISYNHFIPDVDVLYEQIPFSYKFPIRDFAQIKEIDPDKLITEQSFNGKDYQSTVFDYTVYHCTAPYILADSNGDFSIESLHGETSNKFRDELISTSDPSLALVLENAKLLPSILCYFYRDINMYYTPNGKEYRGDKLGCFEYSMLCNIRHNIIPYNGFSKYSRNNTTYIQHGNYNNSNELFIDVFDGDTTVSTFEFVPAHKWYAANRSTPRSTVVCQVAVESTIDTSLDCGDRFSNSTSLNASLVQVNPCNFNNEYIQKNPSYVYNMAYSIDPLLLLYNLSIKDVKDSINTFDYRVYYSNQAEPNLASDPWLMFQPLNYLDVDSKYGQITELRTFKNTLLFWLNHAVGVLSVNERVLIADQSNLPLILGTGGVLDRYDYFSTTNGMKENQHADVQSDHALYWWDYDNNTICLYAGGNSIIPLSKTKSILNFLNRRAKENLLIDTDLTAEEWPLLTYDNKYNEVLFRLSANDSVVYNEQQLYFTSIYDVNPNAYLDFNSKLILLRNTKAYEWNKAVGTEDDKYSYGFGEDKPLTPYLKYVVNNMRDKVKVYDNVEFAGTIPGCFDTESNGNFVQHLRSDIKFKFNTPLRQEGRINGDLITNRQLDFKFAVPRKGEVVNGEWKTREYGDRMRGKTMQCEMSSKSNSLNFSLQYIFTKYRISWS